MTEASRNLAVGITAILGMLGLIFLLVLFGYLPSWMERGYPVMVESPNAGGVHPGSRVLFGGIDIGVVESVQRIAPMGERVRITVQIQPDEPLPEGVTARIKTPSMLGGSPQVHFIVEDEAHLTGNPLPTDGSAVVMGRPGTIFDDVTTELAEMLDGPMGTIERVADNFEALSSEWTAVGRNVRTLTNPDVTTEKVDAGEAVGNLATVLARTDQRMNELQGVIAGLDDIVGDEQVRDDLKTTIANARKMTGKVMETVESLQADISGGVESLTRNYVALADDLTNAVASMQKLVDNMNQGEGTFGRLLNDPGLYENLNDASERLKAALDELRLLVEKWKKEGLPIQF